MSMDTYNTRKLLGICVSCAQARPTPPHVSCPACLERERAVYHLTKPQPPRRTPPHLHPKATTHWWTVGDNPHPVYRTPSWWQPVEEDV